MNSTYQDWRIFFIWNQTNIIPSLENKSIQSNQLNNKSCLVNGQEEIEVRQQQNVTISTITRVQSQSNDTHVFIILRSNHCTMINSKYQILQIWDLIGIGKYKFILGFFCHTNISPWNIKQPQTLEILRYFWIYEGVSTDFKMSAVTHSDY